MPDGSFKLASATKFSFERVAEHVIRTPHKCHNFFVCEFVALASPDGTFKLPSVTNL